MSFLFGGGDKGKKSDSGAVAVDKKSDAGTSIKGEEMKRKKGTKTEERGDGQSDAESETRSQAGSEVGRGDSSSEASSSDVSGKDLGDLDRDMTWREILWSGLIDYGPPYLPYKEHHAPFELVGECSVYNARLWKVHSLLNEKVDPNERDPEDLYYTAGHWCVRNCHYPHLRLLYKAGADLNLLNELGESMLGMACLLKFAEDKYMDNIRIVRFLVENGADIEHRDKAGYAPLDFAALNNHKEISQLLLDNGATVDRENNILVAKRRELLDCVTDPDLYRMLNSKVKVVKALKAAKEALAAEIKRHEDEQQKIRDNQLKFEERRRKKKEEKARIAGEAFHKKQLELIAEAERNDMNQTLGRDNDESKYKYGSWQRDTYGHWEFFKTETKKTKKDIIKEGQKTMESIREKYSFEIYNDRWKSLTDGHELEVKWTKSEPFEVFLYA